MMLQPAHNLIIEIEKAKLNINNVLIKQLTCFHTPNENVVHL